MILHAYVDVLCGYTTFQTTVIALVSVINHYPINGLHLFWDTLYISLSLFSFCSTLWYNISPKTFFIKQISGYGLGRCHLHHQRQVIYTLPFRWSYRAHHWNHLSVIGNVDWAGQSNLSLMLNRMKTRFVCSSVVPLDRIVVGRNEIEGVNVYVYFGRIDKCAKIEMRKSREE